MTKRQTVDFGQSTVGRWAQLPLVWSVILFSGAVLPSLLHAMEQAESAESAATEGDSNTSNTEEKDATSSKKPLPPFDDVEQAVIEVLKKSKGYKSGDLLTSRCAKPLFKELESLGWAVNDRPEIEKLFLPEGDWLVGQLQSSTGKKFMRRIAKLPDGFDRVDRMRRMPYGQRQLADLIRGKDGDKIIEYMTTTPGGKNLGEQLSRGKNGKNFNSPTGRLYTEKQLLDRLQQSHDAEREKRGLSS